MKKLIIILVLVGIFFDIQAQSKKVTELPEDTQVDNTDLLYVIHLGISSRKLQMSTVLAAIQDSIDILQDIMNDSLSDIRVAIAGAGGSGYWTLSGNNIIPTLTSYKVRTKSSYDPGSLYDFAAYIAAFLVIQATSIETNELISNEIYQKGNINFLEDWNGDISWTGSYLGSYYDTICKIYRSGDELYFYSDDAGTKSLSNLGANIAAGNLLTKYTVGDNDYIKLGGTSSENTSLDLGSYNVAFISGGDSLLRVNSTTVKMLDSSITAIYSGVIPDTTEVSKMIEDKKIDCENLHAYIDAVNNGVIDCNNAFLSLTASSNQADVSYQWDGSVSGDMGTSNPSLAWTPETITLTVTNNTTSCETTKDIEITYDVTKPTFEKFITSNIAGELVLSAFVTNQQDSTEYGYTWSGSGIQTDVHGQSIKVNAAGIYYIQISNKNTGCDSTEFIVIYESDFETRFSKLISTNGDIVFTESSVGDHNIIKTDIVEGPTALSIYDKAFADTMYNLTWRGIELKYPAINFDFLGYDNNIAVLSISDQYSVSVDSVLFIPTRYCSLTDGSPTDADFSNCKVITHGSGESITLVKDNDGSGNGDNYIVSYNGTNYKWIRLPSDNPLATGTIADNDATPDVTGATTWTYNGTANSVVITDLDNPIVGKTYRIIGNSDTYTITINDGGNFNLEGNWTGGIDDVITIYVQADNDYIQVVPAVDN
jgi:hypothetical protein